MSKETATILKNALALIEKDGWCQGVYHHENGAHCLAGAIGLVKPDWEKARHAEEALRKFTGDRSVVGFNDKRGQSKAAIVSLLKKAIRSQQQLP